MFAPVGLIDFLTADCSTVPKLLIDAAVGTIFLVKLLVLYLLFVISFFQQGELPHH
jgi:hypothetical protein